MARGNWQVDHLLRRAAFGANAADRSRWAESSVAFVIDRLMDFDRQSDDLDRRIGSDAYIGVTTRGEFSPNTNIDDARQRWLFRMVHSEQPLQEKMALFWHNHFATAYSKLASTVGAMPATKMMALKAGELPGPPGQIELFRRLGLGSFRTLLVEIARDPAMLVWLDGRTNTRRRPQENFAREVMELFTFGVGNFAESDVYAAARAFTGWNLRLGSAARGNTPETFYEFFYNAEQHDAEAKTFTFPIYGDGGRTIQARAASDGMQDGLDLLSALARHPETARRLARKLWSFFVSEVEAPDPVFVQEVATQYLQYGTEMKPVVRYVLRSPWFLDARRQFSRYASPVEFVVRAIREIGWDGLSIDAARTPLAAMGQTLFEPPDVSGWTGGPDWFSTGAMLARMNFASSLAGNQRFNLARAAAGLGATSDGLIAFFMDRLTPAPYDSAPYAELVGYLHSSAWTGSDAQVRAKCAGLAKLIVGSSEYQLV